MGNIEDALMAMETGIEEKGVFSTREQDAMHSKLALVYDAMKDRLKIKEKLALQKSAMDARRYYTSTVIGADIHKQIEGAMEIRQALPRGQEELAGIYFNLSSAGVCIFIEAAHISEGERFVAALQSLEFVSALLELNRPDFKGRPALEPGELGWIGRQFSYLQSELCHKFQHHGYANAPSAHRMH